MIDWGQQIVALAGHPDWKVEIGGRSRLARTSRKNTTT